MKKFVLCILICTQVCFGAACTNQNVSSQVENSSLEQTVSNVENVSSEQIISSSLESSSSVQSSEINSDVSSDNVLPEYSPSFVNLYTADDDTIKRLFDFFGTCNELDNPILYGCAEHYCFYREYDSLGFCYHIYVPNGNLIFEAKKHSNTPRITMYNEDLLCMVKSMGSSVAEYIYCDLKNNICSDRFNDVGANSDELVLYSSIRDENGELNPRFIIQNIFDKEKYYKEICVNFTLDPSCAGPFRDGTSFSEDGKTLNITYISDDLSMQTMTVDLY